MVHRSDQGARFVSAEKVAVPDTRRFMTTAGGAIRGRRCGACAGTSVHGPFM